MAAAVYAPNYPGDQAFLNTSVATSTKSSSKKQGDDNSKPSSGTVAAKFDPKHPGDQNFA